MRQLSKLWLFAGICALSMAGNAMAAVSVEERALYQGTDGGAAQTGTAASLPGGATAIPPGNAASYALAPGSGSVTLNDTVALTLRNNPNLKAMQEYRQAAEFDRKKSRSGFMPTMDATAGIGFEQWSDSTTRNNLSGNQHPHSYYDRFDASVTIRQTIWDGFAAWSRYRMADATLTSAEHRLFDNAEALSLDAILAHIEICRQQKMLELSELNVANHRRILQSQLDRERAGASTRADVTQTQARLSRAETSLVDSRLAYETAVYNYRNLTGHIPGQLLPPKGPAQTYPSMETVLSSSLTNNSKVLSKRADIDALFAQKEIGKSAFHPKIFLEASYNYNDHVQSSDTYAWGSSLMLRGQWNLYNGHYDWYTLKGNKARIRQANMELQALRENLAEEAATTWSQWSATQELVRFYTNAVIYNTQTRDMYLQQFNVGSRSLLDVLDSENELYSTSMQLVTSQMNDIAGQYRLITLCGKLLETLGTDRSTLVIDTDENDFILQSDLTKWQIDNEIRPPQ
jgi:adhesin transport system outer membrane protein